MMDDPVEDVYPNDQVKLLFVYRVMIPFRDHTFMTSAWRGGDGGGGQNNLPQIADVGIFNQ